MRKQLFSIISAIVVMLTLSACGAKKGSTTNATGPTAAQWRAGVKGTWVLNSVDREDIPVAYTVKNIFDEAPVECFIGSQWHLPAGNHRGSITFNNDGTLCAPGAVRNIVWSIHNPSNVGGQPQFQFKKIFAGDKPTNVTSGYRMDLSFADGTSLEMRMPIPLDGGAHGNLVFKFSRVQ